MALREIRIVGDEILRKKSREVKEVTPRIKELISDMFETLYKEEGVGLAAPQVGVLRRVVVIDAGVEEDVKKPMVFINPVIIEMDGEQTGEEGCLSVPDKSCEVRRAEHVVVEAFDEDMNPFSIDAHGLIARCLQHEIDHLEGILYIDRVKEQEAEEKGE
ncbi:peptide deformylase [Howardella ureilytica]|nr:peptide deformylase [Lachnospiraceae bacterium]MDY2957006.1 peptide deformylase [Lachnospiraceae bacterium]